MKAITFGVAVCLASWFGLLIGAGNVGLQRAVTAGPSILILEHPLAVPLLVGSAFMVALALPRMWRSSPRFALVGAAAVLAGDLVGSFVLAPLAVGELEIEQAPGVFLIISFFGAQIVAAFAGAWMGARLGARGER